MRGRRGGKEEEEAGDFELDGTGGQGTLGWDFVKHLD